MFCYVTYPTLKRKRDSHYYYLTENKAVSVELLGTKTEQCNAVAKRYTKTGQILIICVLRRKTYLDIFVQVVTWYVNSNNSNLFIFFAIRERGEKYV